MPVVERATSARSCDQRLVGVPRSRPFPLGPHTWIWNAKPIQRRRAKLSQRADLRSLRIRSCHDADRDEFRRRETLLLLFARASAQRITRSAASGLQVPKPKRHGGRRRLKNTRSAAAVPPCNSTMNEALQRRASARPLVGCYAELARAMRHRALGTAARGSEPWQTDPHHGQPITKDRARDLLFSAKPLYKERVSDARRKNGYGGTSCVPS